MLRITEIKDKKKKNFLLKITLCSKANYILVLG